MTDRPVSNHFNANRLMTNLSVVGALMLLSYAPNAAAKSSPQALRIQYNLAQKLLEENKVDEFKQVREQLDDYPLAPYLDYRLFNSEIATKTPEQVNAFETEYKDFPFVTLIRPNYLDALAGSERWADLLKYQTESPNNEKYRCYYHYAQFKTGNKQAAYQGATALFLSGGSVNDACDPLFAEWANAGHRTDSVVLDRMVLSIPNQNTRFTTTMSKWLRSSSAKAQGQSILDMMKDPSKVRDFSKKSQVTERNQKIVAEVYQLWARKDIASAVNGFDATMAGQKMPQKVQNELADFTVFRLMYPETSQLAAWRDKMIKKTKSGDMVERRIRLAIEQNDWKEMEEWITYLPATLKDSLRWQYWQARVELKKGQKAEGEARLQKILGQRDFYSVAAADWLKTKITYPKDVLENPVDVSSKQKALKRIEEMFITDKIISAKQEWRYLLSNSSLAEQQALAQYASDHDWHHLAILATIQAKMWGYLDLRFPVANSELYKKYAEKHGVSYLTMMALSRQESAMDTDAQSHVGARGLMQLMPATASYTAKKYGIEYSNVLELHQAEKNIEIGSAYLAEQMKDYDNNRIFSFAAYNAGPNRVTRWRGRSGGKLDAYMFAEVIPFSETRNYVQNILMFETYYRDLLGVEGSFLTAEEAKQAY